MILSVISSSISIDKIIQKTGETYVHFISYLDDAFVVPPDFQSVIYTSKHIARVLALKKMPIPLKYFKEVKPEKPIVLTLRNGQVIKVTMFADSSYTGNLAFHFESESRTALYCGRILNSRLLINNRYLLSYLFMGIDFVYVDNTRANSSNLSSIENAGSQIKDIFKKYPKHQIYLNIPAFGFEDLLVRLVKIHKLKVTVGTLLLKAFEDYNIDNIFERDHTKANVIVGEESIAVDKIERRFRKHNKITLRLIECDFEPKNMNFEKFGLFQLHCSPHPSLFDMYGFIQTLAPKYVFEIFDDCPKVPKFIKALCKNENVYEQQNDNNNIKKPEQFNLDTGDAVMLEPTSPTEKTDVPSLRSGSSDCIVINEGLVSSGYNLPRKRVYKGARNVAVVQPNVATPQDFEEFLAVSNISDISLSLDCDDGIDTDYLEVVELEDLHEKNLGKFEKKVFKNKPKKNQKQIREHSKLSKLGDMQILGSTTSVSEKPQEKKKRQKEKSKTIKNIHNNSKNEKRSPVPMCVIPEKTKISIPSKLRNRMRLLSSDLE